MGLADTLKDKVNPNSIIRDVQQSVGDTQLRSGLTRGWYERQLREAIDELSFSVNFPLQEIDIDIPASDWNFQLELPSGIIDIKALYLWDSNPSVPTSSPMLNDLSSEVVSGETTEGSPGGGGHDDTAGGSSSSNLACWDIARSCRVWLKENMTNGFMGGSGFIANRSNTSDFFDQLSYFQIPFFPTNWQINYLRFASLQNGILMFAPACSGWPKLKIVYKGTEGEYGEVPCIARFLVKYCNTYLKMKFAEKKMGEDPRNGWAGIYDRHNESVYNRTTGSFWLAQERIQKMSQWERDALQEYDSRGNW